MMLFDLSLNRGIKHRLEPQTRDFSKKMCSGLGCSND